MAPLFHFIFCADFFESCGGNFSSNFFFRLLMDIISMLVLIRLIYFPAYRKTDFFFAFFMLNIIIFIFTYLMDKVELSMGAAFGLFAVFSLLRFRTEGISIKDMTYLFVVIAFGLINAVNKGSFIETGLISATIILCAWLLEANVLMKKENTMKIQYSTTELIKPGNQSLLIEDLKKQTGLDIHKVSVDKIDLTQNVATIIVYYYDEKTS